ncbi:hypothetical protein AAEX28_01655 [Lentisphaerota bacterium WC36G]|nr:hypothetical protein LJT99_04540 [Lentisphaerae bacterium WC36]
MSDYQIYCLHENPNYYSFFSEIPKKIYENDSNYTKEDSKKVLAEINRFSDDSCLPLVAVKNGMACARLCAIIPDIPLKGYEKEKVGLIGYFEACNDSDIIKAILDEAIEWFAKKNISKVIGPMDGDTWHRYRFVSEQSDNPVFLSEPYNPDYYSELWENYGFKKLAGYYSKFIPNVEFALPIMERFYKRAVRNGFTFRTFNTDDFENELKKIYEISCDSFSDNFLYKEIDKKEFIALYDKAKKIIKPELIWFCYDKNNVPCGFAFAIPDYGEMLRNLLQKSLIAKLKALWKFHFYDTVNLKSIGSLKRYKNKGVGPALTYKIYESTRKLKRKKVNMCLIHDNNVSGRLDGDHGEVFRRYTIYEKDIKK